MGTSLERTQNRIVPGLSVFVLGAGFILLFLDFQYFYAIWIAGFAVILAIVAIRSMRSADTPSEETNISNENTDTTDTDNPQSVVEEENEENITLDEDTFASYRKTYRTYLRENSLSSLRKDPRFVLYLLDSLAALDTFFALYESNNSVEETFSTIDQDTFEAIHERNIMSVHWCILVTFQELGFLTTPEDRSDILPIDKNKLTSLGVSDHVIPDERDIYAVEKDDLVALHDTVLSTLDEDTAPPLDTATISAIVESDLSLIHDETHSTHDPVNISTFDWDTLASFNKNIYHILNNGAFSTFDEHVITRLHEDIQSLLNNVDSPSSDTDSVTLLDDIDSDAFEESDRMTLTDGLEMSSVCELEDENLSRVISVLDGSYPFRWDADELSALGAFYSLRTHYDNNDTEDGQFERELSELLKTETEEGQKRSTYGIASD